MMENFFYLRIFDVHVEPKVQKSEERIKEKKEIESNFGKIKVCLVQVLNM